MYELECDFADLIKETLLAYLLYSDVANQLEDIGYKNLSDCVSSNSQTFLKNKDCLDKIYFR